MATLRLEQRLAHASGRSVPVEIAATPLPAAGPEGAPSTHELVIHFEDLSGHAGAYEAPRGLRSGQTAA